MALRTALKKNPQSGAKRDHARSGSSTSTRSKTLKKTRPAPKAPVLRRSIFSRRKRAPQTPTSAKGTTLLGRRVTGLVTTVAASLCLLGVIVVWGYLVYLPGLFTPSTSRFIALVPETTDAAETAVYIAWLGPSEAESQIWQLPASVPVELPESYGQYRLGSVYPLLNIDQRSEHFVDAVLTRSVKAVIEGHVVLTADTAGQPLSARIWQHAVAALRSFSVSEVKTAAQIWHLSRQTAHQSQLQTVAELQQQVKKLQKGVYPPECSVAILNASETAGEATALSQVIELNGITAIRVDTYPVKQAESNLYIQPGMADTCQPVISVLQKVFTLSEGILAEENTQITNQYHAPIVVVAGERF